MTTYRVGQRVKVIGNRGGIKHGHKIGSIGKVIEISSLSCKVLVGEGSDWQWVNFIDLSLLPKRKAKKVLKIKIGKTTLTTGGECKIHGHYENYTEVKGCPACEYNNPKKPAKPKKENWLKMSVFIVKGIKIDPDEEVVFYQDEVNEQLIIQSPPYFGRIYYVPWQKIKAIKGELIDDTKK